MAKDKIQGPTPKLRFDTETDTINLAQTVIQF